MRTTTRAALGAAALSLALLLAACGGDDSADRSTTTTTTEVTTSSSAAETPTETTAPPGSGETTAPPGPASTAPPSQAGDPLPEAGADVAAELVRAWGAGDREGAARYASDTDVQTLFGLADPGGPSWELDRCTTIEDDPQCVYRSAQRDETVIVHLGEGTPMPVSFVFVYVPA